MTLRRPWLWLCVSLAPYLAQVVLYLRHVNDDAYITFLYSRFLASGQGPYFNVGEHVEGYTNLLQMLLMAGTYALAGADAVPPAAKSLGIVSGGVALALGFVLCRRLAEAVPALRDHATQAAATATGLVAVSRATR